MIPKFASLLLAAIATSPCFAAAPEALSAEEAAAIKTLSATKQFCGEAVGFAGSTPREVLAVRTLLKSPQGDAAFKRLLVRAGTAGKLYALCGLYYTDPPFFERAVQPFRHSTDKVETFMGCIVSSDTASSIVESRDPTAVRLESRSQTIKQWTEAHKADSMKYDIIGGGWPNIYKESGGFRRK